jgi:uncharacterized RDD family membrane protein YckC
MACPSCGEVCRCTPQSTPGAGPGLRRSRFSPEKEDGLESHSSAILIDPEASDCSEQQFIASLEERTTQVARSRFVLDEQDTQAQANSEEQTRLADIAEVESGDLTLISPEASSAIPPAARVVLTQQVTDSQVHSPLALSGAGKALGSEILTSQEDSFWKDEVAARLSHYRARRKPRPPKYPSLRLKFNPTDRKSDPEMRSNCSRDIPATCESVAFIAADALSSMAEARPALPPTSVISMFPGETARIIEFPRSCFTAAFPPASTGDELADPVLERPRIVEVPELDMPAPALGGITLEVEEPEAARRPGFEIPLQAASKGRRLMASGCDAGIVLGACTIFGYIVFKIAGGVPPIATVSTLGCALAGLFWSAYQYLLLTYAGTTPGLRISHLRLSQFDGSPVTRKLRRWRVLASILSGLSLGLGYAWCFLDEDALCWHDRITRTYLEPLK